MQEPLGTARWTVVIPYFDEEGFLPATLASLTAQTLRPFRVVLVDNGSRDGSAALARAWADRQIGIEVQLVHEPTPGQVHALARGVAGVSTEFLAIADADTFYPPHYLATADRLLRAASPDVAGFIGHDIGGLPHSIPMRAKRWFYSRVAPWLLPWQAHGGGYAHCLRTASYRASGGYSPRLWPYVLKDHELANRLWKQGRLAMDGALWVRPSIRRADRRAVRWTLGERILYHGTPPVLKDWFWYGFMAERFRRRGLRDTVLRQRGWETARGPAARQAI
jgi:glycosyltransferase involved in cell wall biosynthesis